MDRNFDKYLDNLSQPLVEAPVYQPEPTHVPMEKIVQVELGDAVENRTTYDQVPDLRKERIKEGLVAPPVDVYEPSFRSDLSEAIINFFKHKRSVKENNDRIRRVTGIGRTL